LGNIVPEPDSTEHAERRRNYAVALREQARAEIDFGQKADAEELLERSVAYLEPLIEQAKDNRSRKLLEEDLEQTRRLQRMLPTTSNENG
jgi:hypothetical protein